MPFSNLNKKNKRMIILGLVLLLSFLLRFYNIQNIGLKYSDEGIYLYEASWLNGDDYGDIYEPMSSLKPLFVMFVSTSLKIFGYHDYSGLIVSALFGALTVFIVFLIGKELYNWNIGIMSALIFSVTKLHLIFSRTLLAESTLLFFFSLTILFYILAKKKESKLFYILTGVTAGLCFEVKYIAAILIVLISVYEFILAFKNGFKKFVINIISIITPFLTIFFVFFGIYKILGINYSYYLLGRMALIGIGEKIITHVPFLANIPRINIGVVYGGNIIMGILKYIYYSLATIHIVTLLLFVIGIFILIKKKSKSDLFVLFWLISLTIFLVKLAHGYPRDFILILPIICITAAKGLDIFKSSSFRKLKDRLFKRSKFKPNIVILVLFLVIILNIIGSLDVLRHTSQGYKEAGNILIKDNVNGTISTIPSLIAFYTHKSSELITTKEELINLYSKGYTHIVIDTWRDYRTKGVMKEINEEIKPFYIINLTVEKWRVGTNLRYALQTLDNKTNLPFLKQMIKKILQNIETSTIYHNIKIYKLDNVIKELN